MGYDRGLIDWLAEAMAPIGTVTHRPMMGVAMLYCDGLPFAVVDEEAIWLKADATSDPEWEARGCPRFTFTSKAGETAELNYRRATDAAYDDADELRQLGELGLAAAQRKPAKRKRS